LRRNAAVIGDLSDSSGAAKARFTGEFTGAHGLLKTYRADLSGEPDRTKLRTLISLKFRCDRSA
jgi:hypothetical protein